ncbi:MAG: Crp/Fnr family transcriptional regulator [Devosia sp.]
MPYSKTSNNLILSHLSADDFALLGVKDKVDLKLYDPLEKANTPLQFVYFIEAGLASVVASVPERGAAEVGVIGFEGMTGVGVVFGDMQSPFDAYVQCEGTALRIDVLQLQNAIAASTTLKARMLVYARAYSIQVATTAYANGRSSLVERLARRLLMISDRMGETFNITHEFLSTTLAVRRSGVTEAIHVLEAEGLIINTRATIQITDRVRLVDASQGSYGLAECEYRRLLPDHF